VEERNKSPEHTGWVGAKINVEIYHDQLRDDVYSQILFKEQLCLRERGALAEETYEALWRGRERRYKGTSNQVQGCVTPGKGDLPRTSRRHLDPWIPGSYRESW
jgi:hypothetical protein